MKPHGNARAPLPPCGGGREGEATDTEQAASPSPALQPKPDLSDFGRPIVPKSGKPDFGASGGEGAGALPRGRNFPNSTARSEVLAGRACPNMRAEDGFPVATRRSMIMIA